jgi:hypothetical protein
MSNMTSPSQKASSKVNLPGNLQTPIQSTMKPHPTNFGPANHNNMKGAKQPVEFRSRVAL